MTNNQGTTAFDVPFDDVISRRLDDVVILINLKSNRIFELNSTGGRLWELISGGSSREEITDTMLREFDVSEPQLTTALEELAATLAAEGLIGHRDST